MYSTPTTGRQVRAAVLSTAMAVSAVLLLAGCSRSDDAPDGPPTAPDAVMVDGDYSDERFIDMMVPHHQMGIDMAEQALDETEDDDIRDLSERIVRAQTNEIEELKRVRQELYGSRETPDSMSAEAMQSMGMGDHGSSGGQTDHADHEMSASSTDDFDRRWLDDMLTHHAAAIQHASAALVHSDNLRIRIIAREIVDKQALEIGMMGGWRLDRWEHVP